MITKNNLVKVQDKLTDRVAVITDHNLELNSIWLDDKTRPWNTYSKEAFRRFWDIRHVDHRK